MLIKELLAKKIKDSRNENTIEVSANGQKASSPSGKSTGKYETPSFHNSLEWNIKAINSLKINFEINSFYDISKIESLIRRKFNLSDVKQFGANYKLISLRGLGITVPPPYLDRHMIKYPKFFKFLTSAEKYICQYFPFNSWGDYSIISLQKVS